MEEKIYSILENIRPEFDFHESEDFVEDGFLDSFDVISLVSMLEETFNITISGLDVLPENFNTVKAICDIVEKNK